MRSLTAEYEAQLSGAQEQNEQKIKDIQGKCSSWIHLQDLFTRHVGIYIAEHQKQLEEIQERVKNEQEEKIKELEGKIVHLCMDQVLI